MIRGEELGLPEVVDIPSSQRQDPTFFRTNGHEIGRDGCRVPIPWSAEGPNFGNGSGKPTHLPQPEWFKDYTVESEQGKQGSTLEMYKAALKLRRELLRGTSEELEWVKQDGDNDQVLHFQRQGGWEVIMNFESATPVELPKGAQVLVQSAELEDGKVGQETTVWFKRA